MDDGPETALGLSSITCHNDVRSTGVKQIYNLQKKFDMEGILTTTECYKDNPSYDSYKTLLQTQIDQYVDQVTPMGYVLHNQDAGRMECLVTLGADIDGWIKEAFDGYQYLEGMMLNAWADNLLYEATNDLYSKLLEELEEGSYLSIRYEPGNTNVDMEVQKELFDSIVPVFGLDMRITEGFMLAPSKSLVYYYELTDEDCARGIDHDCSHCEIGCSNRKYIVTLHEEHQTRLIQGKNGVNLLDLLRQHDVFVDAPCGGKKVCGKCKIKVSDNTYVLNEDEKAFLGDSIQQGYILACYHELDQDLEIYLNGSNDSQHDSHRVETGYVDFEVDEARYDVDDFLKKNAPVGVAVDIGTTTLVVSLINMVTHDVVGLKKALNPQKAFGADVISRIQHVSEDPYHPLGRMVRETIETLTFDLINETGYDWHHIEEMVISGNTTMIYLLLDMDPAKLAVAPFETVDMSLKEMVSTELFAKVDPFKVIILPWISAYVGGDILSGMYVSRIHEEKRNVIFIDIGTNGEMVIKSDKGLVSAATAAGPAFEGANIKHGMGSIAGAICEVKAVDDGYEIVTLGDTEPVGINGSALVDIVSILLKQGHVDAYGYMEEPVMIHDDIGIFPEDIRQVQLAKGAIRAGVEVLMSEAGVTVETLDAIYIAGGFGSHMDIDHAIAIGLIPKGTRDKVKVVGNTSLAGAVRYLLEAKGQSEMETILKQCEYLELSSNLTFNTAYMDSMLFEME